MRLHYRRFLATLAIILLGVLAATGSVDKYGADYAEQGFTRALATFAVARGLNGVISMAQGTEVAIQPAGVGINFTPGQILDPINDLVERFSWVMLASTTSLGLQKLLLTIFSSTIFTYLIGVAMVLLLFAIWYRGKLPTWFRPLAYRIALMLLVLRFAVPLVALATEGVFTLFLEEQYTASSEGIEKTTEDIAQVNQRAEAELPQQEEDSLLGRAWGMVDRATAKLDVDAYVERYKAAAANASEHAIQLIVIFVLQTILLPLLLLWLLLRLLKWGLQWNPLTRLSS